MIIHNPKISGSLQFPSDENGNLITLQVQNGTLETITLNSSGVDQNVQPSVNYSGSFTGSFVGDGSSLTGVSAINIDALSSLGGATVAQGDSLVVSDAGTEKKVTFSNLEDSIFGNVSGDITIAAGGASTLASIANSKLANSSITIDGSAISLGGSVTTTNTQLSTEAVQDIAGALVATGGTKTGIAVTYQDGTGDVDFVVTFPSQTDENFTTADHSKLDGIEASATADQTGGEIKTALFNESDTNNLTDTLKSKLDAIEGSATADQTNAEIKAAVEAATDSNTFTDDDHNKLDGIAASANNYVLPTNLAGDDVDIDTTVLSGATVISDLDINITTNTSGLVTDANGSIATRDLTKADLSLGNVDNTSDAGKPVSTAGQTALDLKANLASPSLSGNPTAPTQADNDDSTKIATTAYVQREVSDLLGGAPAAFDTLLEISASIANGDSDVVALTTTVGTKLAKASNLSDLANASTSRTNLGVDAAGTDNSTNVTLVTSAHDYLSVSGQAITLGSITNDDLAGSIAASKLAGSIGNSKLSNSSITIDGSAISLGGSVSTLQLGTSNSTALAGDTVTISGGQSSAITANTAKNTNVSTNLSISGTSGARTIASSDGTNAIIPIATTSVSGLLSPSLFDEIDANTAKTGISGGQTSAITANTAKVTNVSTDLSKTTAAAQITINSSDGDNVVIGEATTSIAGLMSTTHHDKLDGIESSATADQSNAEIRAAVEAATNSNVFTDTDHSKLNAIEDSATADQTNAEIRAAVEAASDSNVFTDTDHSKLDGISTSADVTDGTTVAAAGALMDSELTDLAGVKGVTISTLQPKPSEGAFANGDKTKLDAIEAGANVTDTANVKSSLNASLGGSANIGDGSDTITIPGDLVVTGTTTTENVTTLTTSNGIVFEGSVADEHEATLLAGTLSADRTLTLPNATGTIALTSNLASVGDGGLTQNNFTNTLKSKLDGIEDSATADQTASELRSAIGTGNGNLVPSAGSAGTFLKHDGTFGTPSYTTNTNTTTTADVTTAGALMDSEVTNLAEVKAFDSTDYATSAQGTKADAALPKGGGAMTGAITTNSTFDGRDVATDGTKLDGIESNATADQTAAQIRTLVGTGNSGVIPSAGSAGTFLKHDGTFGTPSYTTNTDTNTQLSQEQVQDFVGNMLGGTETGITVTYQDSTNDIDFVVASQTANDFTNTLKSKLDGIEGSATADQSNAEIRAAVEAATDSNVFTDTDHSKLNAIEDSATADQTASEIRSLVGTGNSNFVPSAGTVGHFLKHDGSFGLPSYTTNTDVDVSIANLKTKLAGGFSSNAVSIGDSGDTVTIPGDLVVTGTTTTNNVETVSTSNGVVFEGSAADDNEVTLKAGTVSADRTATLPNKSGTIAMTSDITGTNSNTNTGDETKSRINALDITELGTITSGVWQGSAISTTYLSGQSGTNTGDETKTRINALDITELGTITSGVWNGSVIASAKLDADTAHLSGTQTFSGAKTFSSTTASTSKTTGAVIVTGGVGISGALNVGGDVVAFASSDERLKDNIELISNPIERVQALKGVTWNWNDNADELQQSLPNVGVIAQDVEKVLPQLVTNRDNGYKGVDYAKLTGLLIEAVKDQQKQIDELKSKLS